MTTRAKGITLPFPETIYTGKRFGLKGIGGNETSALRDFFNSMKENPGVPHILAPGIYCTTAELPTIDVGNLWLQGFGAGIHDVGNIFDGPVIKWIGASGARMQLIAPGIGVTKQRLGGIQWNGICYDCNSLASIGLEVKSIRNSNIWVATANATAIGISLGVVSVLGEARDLQDCSLKLFTRQVEHRPGTGVVMSGDAGANVSFNEVFVESQHADGPAVICNNVDNNIWTTLRTNCIFGGTSTESISLLGGAIESESARLETFNKVSGNKPMHVYGTAAYAYPSVNHWVDRLDTANGTPVPVVEVGGSIGWIDSNNVSTTVAQIKGAFGGNLSEASAALTRLGTATIHAVSSSDNNIAISDSTNANRWGFRIDGGNLMMDRQAGVQYYRQSIGAVPNAADDTAAAALSPPVPIGGEYRTGSIKKIRVA